MSTLLRRATVLAFVGLIATAALSRTAHAQGIGDDPYIALRVRDAIDFNGLAEVLCDPSIISELNADFSQGGVLQQVHFTPVADGPGGTRAFLGMLRVRFSATTVTYSFALVRFGIFSPGFRSYLSYNRTVASANPISPVGIVDSAAQFGFLRIALSELATTQAAINASMLQDGRLKSFSIFQAQADLPDTWRFRWVGTYGSTHGSDAQVFYDAFYDDRNGTFSFAGCEIVPPGP